MIYLSMVVIQVVAFQARVPKDQGSNFHCISTYAVEVGTKGLAMLPRTKQAQCAQNGSIRKYELVQKTKLTRMQA